jgi:hypothetical protein
MRRLQLPAAVALVHAALVITAISMVIGDIGRNFPQSPSLLGNVWAAFLYVLGFPLVTGAFAADVFPFFGPQWQPYALIAANSLIWALAARAIAKARG